jgi:hypothetical protein
MGRTVGLVGSISPGRTPANLVLPVVQGLLPLATLFVTKLITNAVVQGVGWPDRTAASRRLGLFIPVVGRLGLDGRHARLYDVQAKSLRAEEP